MAGAVAPIAAVADTSKTASTEVTLQASAELSKLSIAVPTDLVLVVDGAGDIVGPKDGAYQIDNGSVYGVHVAKIQTTAAGGTNIVADASASDAKDAVSVDMTFTGGTKAPGAAIKLSDTLNTGKANPGIDLGYEGVEGSKDVASATFTGKAKNLTKDYTQGQKIATVNYAFAVGNTPIA